MIRRVTSSAIFASLLLFSISGWAQKPELVVQTGHSDNVLTVAFSPDEKTLASGSVDHTIKLWDVASGRELRTLTRHSNEVNSIAFSPDGNTLASNGGEIKLWDVRSGRELRTLTGHYSRVAFSPDGNTLAAGAWDNTIRLWDAPSGRELPTLTGHSSTVGSIAFSPAGTTLASGSRDNTIKLWDVRSGRDLRTFTGHSNEVKAIAFSPDGNTLASGSSDQTIKLWDVTTGRELRTLLSGYYGVDSVAFSPDGKTLASGSWEDFIKLWDVTSGRELRTLSGYHVTSVAFNANGKVLATGSGDGTIKLWNVITGRELRTLSGHATSVASLAFSEEAKALAIGSRIPGDSTNTIIKLWDVTTGRELRNLLANSSHLVDSVSFSPDGNKLASSSDAGIKLWDVATGRELNILKSENLISSVAFSPNGKTLASGIYREGIKLWDVDSGRELRILEQSDCFTSVVFSPNGNTLACGSWEDFIKLWDVTSGRELRTLSGYHVTSVAFNANGKVLATGSGDGTIKLWNVITGRELRTLRGHSDPVLAVGFSRDGKTLASGSSEGSIKLWEVASGREMRTLTGHSNRVDSVVFSADGRRLVSGSYDASIKVWDTDSGQELTTLIALDEHGWLVVTPDGLFDGSSAAWNKILWRFNNNTFDHAPVEAFFNEYYYPGLLQDIFAGKRPKAPSDISQKDRRQPQLKLTAIDTQRNATSNGADPTAGDGGNPTVREGARNATVKIDILEVAADRDHKAGSGAQDVRLFRNGSLVKVWRGDVLNGNNSVTLTATVPIVAGENKFTAYAFNHDNIKSSDAELTVTGADSLKRQGTAYILAIGVNSYSNSQYNLKYAVADAEDFAAEIKRQQESLNPKRYAKVEVVSLSNAEATKANITKKVTELAKQVQPEDAVIVFFAGHGTAQANQFYLIPHDLDYNGPRDDLTKADLETILAHSISDRDLEKLFEGIDAGQLLLVIDACNSGQALEAEEKRRGPMNSKGLAQLAYEKGMYVLTAAQSYQAANEAARFGHGFLTYALVEEGLKQGAADREPKNGGIDIREWLNYATDEVPRMQENNSREALRGRGRYVVFVGDGREVGIPKTEADARDNIQRPRVFYRRELEANPLVIAITNAASPKP